jgi:hypothetical protein
MNVEDLDGLYAILIYSQATYLLLETGNGSIRVNFIRKKEFSLKKGAKGTLSISAEHPLLYDYNQIWATTYINSKAALPDLVESEIQDAIANISRNFRSWLHYVPKGFLMPTEILNRNLREGYGLLLEAPISITNEVINICDKHAIRTKTFESPGGVTPQKVLLLEDSYVIAEDFKLKF